MSHTNGIKAPGVHADPVNRAEELEALIVEHSKESTARFRLADPIANAIAGAQLGHISVPVKFGGESCDANTYYRVIETVSYADGSAGWCVNVWAEHSDIIASYFSDETVKDVLSTPNVLVCGSNNLNPMEAHKVDQGIRVKGRFFSTSGIHNSQWATWGTFLHENGQPMALTEKGRPILFTGIVPVKDLEVLETWKTMGLEGSGTHDFKMDLVTPKSRLIRGYGSPLRPGLSVKLSLFGFISITKCAVLTGIARSLLDTLSSHCQKKKPLFSPTLLSDSPVVRQQIGESEAKLRASRLLISDAMSRCEQEYDRESSLSTKAKTLLHLAITNASQASVDIATMANKIAGTSAIFSGSPIQRKVCDLLVAGTHPNLRADRYASLGSYFLGGNPFENQPI